MTTYRAHHAALLTAEPEPCEDADEDMIRLRRFIQDHAFPASLAYDLTAIVNRLYVVTQVSDKRAEELRKVVSAFLSIYDSRQDITRDDFTYVYQLALAATEPKQ